MNFVKTQTEEGWGLTDSLEISANSKFSKIPKLALKATDKTMNQRDRKHVKGAAEATPNNNNLKLHFSFWSTAKKLCVRVVNEAFKKRKKI